MVAEAAALALELTDAPKLVDARLQPERALADGCSGKGGGRLKRARDRKGRCAGSGFGAAGCLLAQSARRRSACRSVTTLLPIPVIVLTCTVHAMPALYQPRLPRPSACCLAVRIGWCGYQRHSNGASEIANQVCGFSTVFLRIRDLEVAQLALGTAPPRVGLRNIRVRPPPTATSYCSVDLKALSTLSTAASLLHARALAVDWTWTWMHALSWCNASRIDGSAPLYSSVRERPAGRRPYRTLSLASVLCVFSFSLRVPRRIDGRVYLLHAMPASAYRCSCAPILRMRADEGFAQQLARDSALRALHRLACEMLFLRPVQGAFQHAPVKVQAHPLVLKDGWRPR